MSVATTTSFEYLAFLHGDAADNAYLQVCFDCLARRLELHGEASASLDEGEDHLAQVVSTMETPPALERLRRAFALTRFEVGLIILSAAWELDGRLSELMSKTGVGHGDGFPCLSLAVRVLPGAHWNAFTPGGALRRWQLLRLEASGSLALSRLRIDEHLLHVLKGVCEPDPDLVRHVQRRVATVRPTVGQRNAVQELLAHWHRVGGESETSAVELIGTSDDTMAAAAHAWERLGVSCFVVAAAQIPVDHAERERFLRRWEREALLGLAAVVILSEDTADPMLSERLQWLAAHARFRLLLASERPLGERRLGLARISVTPMSAAERRTLFSQHLGTPADVPGLSHHLDELVCQFRLDAAGIAAACAGARGPDGTIAWPTLWDACIGRCIPVLDDLAQRLPANDAWESLVLPATQRRMLDDLLIQCRQRATVLMRWGMDGCGGVRGGNLTALFSGASGTGKTFAAECLAGRLRLPLYRIDLSSVVSKYIGETEKHLRRVFDAAELGGAVLLFDEADALFGKRSEVSSSHDRHANIEVGYLLQRLESYTGLAILTTNHRKHLDPAFLRRIRYAVHFPEPGQVERERLWSGAFAPAVPLAALDWSALARAELTGGQIRTAALAAASYAAEAGGSVSLNHCWRGIESEHAKAEKPWNPQLAARA